MLSPAAPETIDGNVALATADRVIAAFNAGDPDGVTAEFLPDAQFESSQPFYINQFSTDLAGWHRSVIWQTASGTTWKDHECAVADGTAVTVVCRYDIHYAVETAVGAPPYAVVTTMVVASGGVREWATEYPLEMVIAAGFGSWLFAHHRDALDGLTEQSSLEEFRQSGLLLAGYAQEWAEFLDAHDCAYPSDCFFETPATGRA